MEIYRIEKFTNGWFLGSFEPSLLKTEAFELALKSFKAGDIDPPHFHKISTEFNILVSGKMIINDIELCEGDVFVLRKGEISRPIFLTDCKVVVCKVPFARNDKYLKEEKIDCQHHF